MKKFEKKSQQGNKVQEDIRGDLETIRLDKLEDGKISESQCGILDGKISEYIKKFR